MTDEMGTESVVCPQKRGSCCLFPQEKSSSWQRNSGQRTSQVWKCQLWGRHLLLGITSKGGDRARGIQKSKLQSFVWKGCLGARGESAHWLLGRSAQRIWWERRCASREFLLSLFLFFHTPGQLPQSIWIIECRLKFLHKCKPVSAWHATGSIYIWADLNWLNALFSKCQDIYSAISLHASIPQNAGAVALNQTLKSTKNKVREDDFLSNIQFRKKVYQVPELPVFRSILFKGNCLQNTEREKYFMQRCSFLVPLETDIEGGCLKKEWNAQVIEKIAKEGNEEKALSRIRNIILQLTYLPSFID